MPMQCPLPYPRAIMTDDKKISKRLSYWLRHKPEDAGLTIDPSGWAEKDAVLAAFKEKGLDVEAADMERVVANSDKGRFEFSEDGSLIRARQGHSIPVSLDWPITDPPEFLFHGTVDRFLDAIMTEGLRPMKRHHVHLSPDVKTASVVGARRGKPVILQVSAARMASEGHEFRLTGNNVWLAESVPPGFLQKLG